MDSSIDTDNILDQLGSHLYFKVKMKVLKASITLSEGAIHLSELCVRFMILISKSINFTCKSIVQFHHKLQHIVLIVKSPLIKYNFQFQFTYR